MSWHHSPFNWRDSSRLPRERRHEPFTPRLPRAILSRPALFGSLLASVGIAGNWLISSQMAGWPSWMLFPSMVLAVLFLVAMMLGLGILVVRSLEPVLMLMEWDWDAEPLAAMGLPLALQRKCERLGYWTAEEMVRSIDHRRFPWTELEYDERMQVERAAERWRRADDAKQARPRAAKRWLPRRAR